MKTKTTKLKAGKYQVVVSRDGDQKEVIGGKFIFSSKKDALSTASFLARRPENKQNFIFINTIDKNILVFHQNIVSYDSVWRYSPHRKGTGKRRLEVYSSAIGWHYPI
jgi:hypothetical protein